MIHKLKIHVTTEDGELLDSVDVEFDEDDYAAAIRAAKFEVGAALMAAVRIMHARRTEDAPKV